MAALGRIGGEDWFNLGDGDMAMHVFRTQALAEGRTLSDVTAEIAETLGIGPRILPMTDETVATVVESANGDLPFQHYFVRDSMRRRRPVTGFRAHGNADAKANAEMMTLINGSHLDSIVVTPSNPFVSIDPSFRCRRPRRVECANFPYHRSFAHCRRSGDQRSGCQNDG